MLVYVNLLAFPDRRYAQLEVDMFFFFLTDVK